MLKNMSCLALVLALVLAGCGFSPAPSLSPPPPAPTPEAAANEFFDPYHPSPGLPGWRETVDAIVAHQEYMSLENLETLEYFLTQHIWAGLVTEVIVADDGAHLSYKYNAEKQRMALATFITNACDLLKQVNTPDANDLDKIFAAYQLTAALGSYDKEHRLTGAFDLLVEKQAICHGYAEIFVFLLEQSGVNALRLEGATTSGGDHGWAMAEINGTYYHFDPMWEHSASKGNALNYFAMSDEARIAASARNNWHTAETRQNAPPAPDDSFMGMRKNTKKFRRFPEEHRVEILRTDGTRWDYFTN